MDGFKDKTVKKFNAQEVIRANMAADAAQLERMEKQVSEYDGYMREMRKLNLKGIENEQKLRSLLKEGEDSLKTALDDYEVQMQRVTEQCMAKIHELYQAQDVEDTETEEAIMQAIRQLTSDNMQAMRQLTSDNMQEMRELFQKSDEHTHRENVKVYRNVQAVISEELGEQKEMTAGIQTTLNKKIKAVIVLEMLALLASLASIGISVAQLLGFL